MDTIDSDAVFGYIDPRNSTIIELKDLTAGGIMEIKFNQPLNIPFNFTSNHTVTDYDHR